MREKRLDGVGRLHRRLLWRGGTRANGCDWDSETCARAAEGGHLEVLHWARANGCEWDVRTCAAAAQGSHLELLQWARAIRCDWNSDTCAYAALGGHLQVLQWAQANGCAWDSHTRKHLLECLLFLVPLPESFRVIFIIIFNPYQPGTEGVCSLRTHAIVLCPICNVYSMSVAASERALCT
jgi:hypothetical protein